VDCAEHNQIDRDGSSDLFGLTSPWKRMGNECRPSRHRNGARRLTVGILVARHMVFTPRQTLVGPHRECRIRVVFVASVAVLPYSSLAEIPLRLSRKHRFARISANMVNSSFSARLKIAPKPKRRKCSVETAVRPESDAIKSRRCLA